jgi:hypothetical protein
MTHNCRISFKVKILCINNLPNDRLESFPYIWYLSRMNIAIRNIHVHGLTIDDGVDRYCIVNFLFNGKLSTVRLDMTDTDMWTYLEKLQQQKVFSTILPITEEGQHNTFCEVTICLGCVVS